MTGVLSIPLQEISESLLREKKLTMFVLRDDLRHPYISGNKWRKLKYNLEEFRNQKKQYLLTFGGAWSNHIVATAATGKEAGIKTLGIIRGEEHSADSNPVLRFASQCGMQLKFVSRDEFRKMRDFEPEYFAAWMCISAEDLYILPEGGANEPGVRGCKEIVADIPGRPDYICCACGTGATLAGISSALAEGQQAIGVAVLKAAAGIQKRVVNYSDERNTKIIDEYHFGGYAKGTPELESFCRNFFRQHAIPVEPVYTGKLFYGLFDLIQKDFFEPGKSIVAVHTGGIYNFSEQVQ